jgi:DNA-binding helix-hairpin-helix protein with protein kinase domain
MVWQGQNSEHYLISRELGRGGEGAVYELKSHRDLVLKEYNHPLSTEKIAKLQQMVAMRNASIEAYAAWPTDIVTNDRGAVSGFVMRKLNGYLPLHSVFNPMDRKKLFPDKGYNFLIHVARNLATAFHKLHEAGLVVGDVNEGNILVNSNGLVAFIDCDSFQVRGANDYFFCEVGVPRYTPPELLKKSSFHNVVRTTNTDSFSLAILIFQLLFLGRHPFAGRHKSTADIDEETAIKQKQFAYSLENTKKKLQPPKDSFAISNLADELVTLFHQAFEQDSRPAPADWVKALDSQLADMASCMWSPMHSYPSKIGDCPWCRFRKERNIVYFPDDSYTRSGAALNDIEQFINGFKPEPMDMPKWHGNIPMQGFTPSAVPHRFRIERYLKRFVTAFVITIAILINVFVAFRLEVIGVAAIAIFFIHTRSKWAKNLRAELRRRANKLSQLRQQLEHSIEAYENPGDLPAYTQALAALDKKVSDFKHLPYEVERRKTAIEEKLYTEQLHFYLARFNISDYSIPSFGPGKKQALYDNGIYTVADISRLATIKVPGIGPKNLSALTDWQKEMSAAFVYIPDTYRIASEMNVAQHEVATLKRKLEDVIHKEYQALSYLRQQIESRATQLDKQAREIAIQVRQAELDLHTFKKFVL